MNDQTKHRILAINDAAYIVPPPLNNKQQAALIDALRLMVADGETFTKPAPAATTEEAK